ncbi:DUF418 domain-containing protein [Dyella sp. OK004]|uniref:DUF418 domain-containing protein n=1 Tax=Dyella sp. OK004 TaxID=1855292 RepID=UPI0015A6AE85|nr:DUF418 domain-containing protein [Dyella sp. OK004]
MRGFALFGVFLVNLTYLSLYAFLPEEQQEHLITAGSDRVVAALMTWLVDIKAITVFSLLFGLGFALQMERTDTASTRRYVRRMLVLAVIGAIHGWFIWWGDILLTYAVVGLLLLPFRHASARMLIGSGLVCALLLPPLLLPWIRPLMQGFPRSNDVYAQALQAFGADSWSVALFQNIFTAQWARTTNWALLLFVLGRFLLGYWAGRVGLLQHPRQHHKLLWRLFLGSLVVGLWAMLVEAFQADLRAEFPLLNSELGRYVTRVIQRTAPLAVGIAWACGFVLLYLLPSAQRWLSKLAPVGRMALTNYLLQSIVGVALFYGIGLGVGPRYGLIAVTLVGVMVFSLQAIASYWWLRRFHFGPVEWLWRSLTYGLRPAWRKTGGHIDGEASSSAVSSAIEMENR